MHETTLVSFNCRLRFGMPGVGLRPCISNEPPGDFGGPWDTVIIEGLDAQSRMNMNGWVRLPSSMHSSSREVEKP